MDDRNFVMAAVVKLREAGQPILELHAHADEPPAAVLIAGDHFDALLELVPESEAATEWIMKHEHIGWVE